MIDIGPVREAEHDSYAAAVEEGHVRGRVEQESHAQDVSIELDGPVEVFDVHKNLADLIQGRPNRDWCGQDDLSFGVAQVDNLRLRNFPNCPTSAAFV